MTNFYNFSNVNNNMILENLAETFLLVDYFLLILVITLSLLLGIKIHMKKYKTFLVNLVIFLAIIFVGYLWFLAVENKHRNIRFELSVLLIVASLGILLMESSIIKPKPKKTITMYLGLEIKPVNLVMFIPWLTPDVSTENTSSILLFGGLMLGAYTIVKIGTHVYSQYLKKEVVPDKIEPEYLEPEYVELSFSGTTHIDIEPINLDSVKSSLEISNLSVPKGDDSSFDFVDLVGETVVKLPIQPNSIIVDGNLLVQLLEKMTLGEQFFCLSIFHFAIIGAGAAAYIHIRRWLMKPEVKSYAATDPDKIAADSIYNSVRDLIKPIPGFLDKKKK